MRRTVSRGLTALCTLAMTAALAAAEPVRNGNELALKYASASADGKLQVRKAATGMFHTFRYLKIVEIRSGQPAPDGVTLVTIEPSSDLRVTLVARQKVSLEVAAGLTTNACVAAKGRVTSIGVVAPDMLVVDPAVLQHADRATPKAGAELLNEVDPKAH